MNFETTRWPAGNPITGYLNTDGGATKTDILKDRRNGINLEKWQLNFGKRPSFELYNIKLDPDCVTNLSESENHKGIVNDLKTQLESELKEQQDPRMFGKGVVFDEYVYANKKGKVNIILIEGSQPNIFYKDNHNAILDLIAERFLEKPTDKQSNHTLILGNRESGVPFFGLGKNCFATSDNFKLSSSGKYLDNLELMNCHLLGGIMHELAHGLNLPHNAHKASELPNISLMSFGNHTYQNGNEELVFLTKSDCAILDVNEAFNKIEEQYYEVSPSIKMKHYTVTKDNLKQATIVEGVFTSELKPTHFYVGHNAYPLAGGYDRITFTVPVIGTATVDEYSFKVEMSYSDIFNGYQAKDVFELSMDIITENGNRKTVVKYDYTIDVNSPEPNDDILKDFSEFIFSDRSKWSITANTKANANQVSGNIIDGNLDSYWHSKWPYTISDDGDHKIEIDMGEQKEINGIYLLSERSGGQFRPKHIIVATSVDGISWVTEKEVTINSMSNAREVYINFDASKTVRFIKLIVDEVYTSNSEENLILTELDVL